MQRIISGSKWQGLAFVAIACFIIGLTGPASGEEPTQPEPTEPHAISSAYDLYWKGIRIFTARTSVRVGEATYNHGVSVRTRGILRLFLKAHGQVQASGIRDERGYLQPVFFAARSQWNKKIYTRTVTFALDGAADKVLVRMPPDTDGVWDPVPEELMRGPDPLSLLVAAADGLWGLAEGSADDNKDEVTIRTFDGVRVMEYLVTCPDSEILKETRRSIFAGPAIRCVVEGEQLAGFWRDLDEENTSREEEAEDGAEIDRRVTLWLAQDSRSSLYLPVRMEIQSQRGKIKVYLTESDANLNGVEPSSAP